MTEIQCRRCQVHVVVEDRAVVSLHHTSGGLVGYVRCPQGHLNAVRFHAPPAAVAAQEAVGGPPLDPVAGR